MKVVKNYSRKPSTRPVKAAEDIEIEDAPVVEEELELEPNDLLLTVEDAAELVGQVASDLAGEEIVVETEIADGAESVDFIVGDETYTAIPEDGDDVVVSAKLLKGKVKITASKKAATRNPATRRPVKASTAVKASREAMARKRRIAAARAKRMGK